MLVRCAMCNGIGGWESETGRICTQEAAANHKAPWTKCMFCSGTGQVTRFP